MVFRVQGLRSEKERLGAFHFRTSGSKLGGVPDGGMV